MSRILRAFPPLPYLFFAVLAVAVLFTQRAGAQQQYRAGRLVFKNPGPYSQAALEAASGLHVGLPFNEDGLQKSDQALMDTGLFDDVQATLDGRTTAVDVIFTLKPTPKAQLLPASFENFAWWSPAELNTVLHQSVPLFTDRVPEAGNLPDAIAAALQSMASAKNIHGHVVHTVIEPTTANPTRSMSFSIEDADLRVGKISIADSGMADRVEDTGRVTSALSSKPYNETQIEDVLLNPYRNAGYLAATLADVKRTPVTTGASTTVDVTATIRPGELYHVASITYTGAPLLSVEDFNKSAKLHAGDIASHQALLDTLQPIDDAYKQQGYMDVVALALPALDTKAHTVAYAVSVVPGEQYHLRSVRPSGLDSKQMELFQSNFKLPLGALYNEAYVTRFLQEQTGPDGGLRGLTAAFKGVRDPESHLVDLTISFVHLPIRP